MIRTNAKPGIGIARWVAKFQYGLGATRANLRRRQFQITGFANPQNCRLYELLAWRRLGALLSRWEKRRSTEARIALSRRRPRRHIEPKFHPTTAERLASSAKREAFRRARAAEGAAA